MANRLGKAPTAEITWFLQCKYCNPKDTPFQERRHETELLAKARRLCKNHQSNHFLDYVTAELDTLDHSILTPITMIEILSQIHTSIKCDCLTDTTTEVEELTKTQHIPTHITSIPTIAKNTSEIIPPSQKPTTLNSPTTRPKPPAKTLLERLKNGSSNTHIPRKI